MKTIHKIQLPLNMGQQIKYPLPFNSKILSCAFQHEHLCVWYITDTFIDWKEDRYFHIIETGDEIPSWIERVNFIGTAIYHTHHSTYVAHVFEGQLVN